MAQDFEAIFAGARPAEAPGGLRARSIRPAEPRSRRPSARLATIGGLVAAALAGLTAGMVVIPGRQAPPAEAPLRVVTNEPLPSQVAPAPTPLSTGLENMPEPVVMIRPRIQRAKAEAPLRTERPKARPCGERCSQAEVMAADRRLRAAYHRAARSGVSRAELVAYRREWDRMRRREADRPQRLVAGYASMTSELSQLARHARQARS